MKTTIYTANSKTHFFKELKNILTDIRSSNFIATQLAKRDISAQYRQSMLGIFWAFAPIIMTSLTWIFLKGTGAVNLQLPDIPYVLFVLLGTTLWSIFVDCINSPIKSVNASKSVISKINFPKEALFVSGIYKTIFDVILKLIVIIILLLIYRISPNQYIIMFPIYIVTLILFGSAIGVLLAPIGLLYTDIGRIIQLGSAILMYATPVVFLVPKGDFRFLFENNPLTPIIISARNCLVGEPLENPQILYYIIPISIILLLIGLVIFRKSMPILIEKIAS